MNSNLSQHSGAWISFTYGQALLSLGMTVGGLVFLPIDIWMKGYLLMGMTMLISAAVSLTKTLRDNEEASKLVNKIEDAKTEQLLMRIDRSAKE